MFDSTEDIKYKNMCWGSQSYKQAYKKNEKEELGIKLTIKLVVQNKKTQMLAATCNIGKCVGTGQCA